MKRLLVSGMVLAAGVAVAPSAAAQHVSVGITVHAPPVRIDVSYADRGHRPGIVVVGHAHTHRRASRAVHRHHVVHRDPQRCSGLHKHGKPVHHKRHR